jgi:TRAP-type mannitol/chloroaromatic compound transport system permease large subunit
MSIFRGVLPFVIGILVAMAIIFALPVLATWLPAATLRF